MSLIPPVTSDNDLECTICADVMKNCIVTNCGHSFCEPCIQGWLQKNNSCAICRKEAPILTANFVLRNLIAKQATKVQAAAMPAISSAALPASSQSSRPVLPPVSALAISGPVTHDFNPALNVREFLERKRRPGQTFPTKTIQFIRALTFHQGIARLTTEKNTMVYRVPQSLIDTYLQAKSSHHDQAAKQALDELVLCTLSQPSHLQIQVTSNKIESNKELEEIKGLMRQKLCQTLNTAEIVLKDFISFDSFDTPGMQQHVMVTETRPQPPLRLTTALPADQFFAMLMRAQNQL